MVGWRFIWQISQASKAVTPNDSMARRGHPAIDNPDGREIMSQNTPRKIQRVFSALMNGQSFNRFEAERKLHDHCLHTTVSTIQQKYGIHVAREFETVPGYMGLPTRCCRYWIPEDERSRINNLREK